MKQLKYIIALSIGILLIQLETIAQTRPYINSISPTIANVGETVTLVGSGFPTSTTDLQVTFGGVKASVTSNSSTLIEVTVPAAATYDEIMVTNTATGLSGSSSQFFMISYGGDPMSGLSQTVFQTLFEGITDLNISTTVNQTVVQPFDLCLCDFDGDGKQDVVVTSRENGTTSRSKRVVFRNTSTVSVLNLTPVLELRNQPSKNATCKDLDGDGKPDLVVSEINIDGIDTGTEDLEVYLNTSSTGSISFASPIFLELPRDQNNDNRDPARIEIADIDLDGKNDILSTAENDNAIDIFLNKSTPGNLSFESSNLSIQLPNEDEFTRPIKVGDFNNDGLVDIALAFRNNTKVYAFENQSTVGNIDFKAPVSISITNQITVQNIEIADINNDGFNDLILADGNQQSGEVIIIKNTSSQSSALSFGPPTNISVGKFNWGLHVGDIDGDKKVDIAVGISDQSEGYINVLINQSTTTATNFKVFRLPTNNNSRNIKIGDINGDAKPDILTVTNSRTLSPGKLSVYQNRNCVTPKLTPATDIYCPGTSFIMTATPAEETTFDFQISTDNGATWVSKQSSTSNTYDLGSDATNTTNVQVKVIVSSNDSRCETTSNIASISLNTVTPSYSTFTIAATSNICEGSDLLLNTTVTADNYFWSGPNDFTSTLQSPTISSITSAGAGTYSLTIQNNGGCKSSSVTKQVSVIATPAPNFTNTGADAFCIGGQTVLETTDFPGFSRQWNANGNPIDGATGTSLTVDATGVYSLTLSKTVGSLTCSASGEALTINEVNKPVATIDSDTEICTDVSMVFNSTVTGASEYNFTYSWDVENSAATSVGSGTLDSISISFADAGEYTANLIVGYELVSNCTTPVAKTITVSAPPTLPITASATVKCPTDTVSLEMPAGLVSYLWSTGDTTPSSIAVTPTGIDTVDVDVTVVTSIGCTVNSTIQITNYSDGGITITSPDAAVPIANQSINIPAGIFSLQLQANGGTNYQWTPELIFDDPESDLVTVRPRSVETDVILTGIDINSCLKSDSVRLVNDNVQARKTFSPNGDGLGFECWEILNSSTLQGCTLYILDKRGRTIHQADTPFDADCAWNGIDVDGKQAPEGVYYFVLKCSDGALNRTGNILLGR